MRPRVHVRSLDEARSVGSWSMVTLVGGGAQLAPGKGHDSRIAGPCFAWFSDISFLLVSLANGSFLGPTQALATRAGSLESDRNCEAGRRLRKLHRVRPT